MIAETASATMLPYKREPIDIRELIDFAPDEPEPLPEAMSQGRIIRNQILSPLDDHLAGFGQNPRVFVDSNSILCYDRSNLNARIQPDFYAAFGVDLHAILEREVYLPWEVGKPPDFAMEVASKSTASYDVTEKMEIYRRIGVPELWHFDHTGGDFYGKPLAGWRLSGGEYLPIETREKSDGEVCGYGETIGLYLCWDDGRIRFFDPIANRYLRTASEAHADSRKLDAERAAHAITRRELMLERAAHAITRRELIRVRAALESERAEHDKTRRELESERAAHAITRRELMRVRQARESQTHAFERESERTRRLEEELRRLRGEE